MNSINKDELKERIEKTIKETVSNEDLLAAEELENTEGGACALGCTPGCFLFGTY